MKYNYYCISFVISVGITINWSTTSRSTYALQRKLSHWGKSENINESFIREQWYLYDSVYIAIKFRQTKFVHIINYFHRAQYKYNLLMFVFVPTQVSVRHSVHLHFTLPAMFGNLHISSDTGCQRIGKWCLFQLCCRYCHLHLFVLNHREMGQKDRARLLNSCDSPKSKRRRLKHRSIGLPKIENSRTLIYKLLLPTYADLPARRSNRISNSSFMTVKY